MLHVAVPAPIAMSKSEMAKREKEWRAESDLNTLVEAEKIRKDPARIKAVKARKKELEKSLKSV